MKTFIKFLPCLIVFIALISGVNCYAQNIDTNGPSKQISNQDISEKIWDLSISYYSLYHNRLKTKPISVLVEYDKPTSNSRKNAFFGIISGKEGEFSPFVFDFDSTSNRYIISGGEFLGKNNFVELMAGINIYAKGSTMTENNFYGSLGLHYRIGGDYQNSPGIITGVNYRWFIANSIYIAGGLTTKFIAGWTTNSIGQTATYLGLDLFANLRLGYQFKTKKKLETSLEQKRILQFNNQNLHNSNI